MFIASQSAWSPVLNYETPELNTGDCGTNNYITGLS